MALITWNSTYSVNVKEIDLQHQKLIALINQLHDGMKAGKGKEITGKILSDLADYTKFHFGYEEKLFDQTKYPDTMVQKRQHSDLVKQVVNYISKFQKGEAILTMELMNFLKDWLMNHIVATDKKYTSFLNSKGIY
ncbi:MAG: hemerythrin [Ignavibacteriales bacterium CG_4_9_14_3_um_filter_34_10]|nr:MAG: hemerythrin [Ignavibacteriales bacterium CG_4_9_14_3_um_filter_34_10]